MTSVLGNPAETGDEAREHQLLDASGVCLYACAAKPPFARTFISDNVSRLLGWSRRDFLRDPAFWSRWLHPADSARVSEELPAILAAGRGCVEYRFRHRDGSWHWLRDEMRVVPGEPGQPTELAGFWTDLTARHEAEDELRRSREALHSLLAHLPQNIIRKDRDGRLTFVNERFCQTSGRRAEEFVGRTDLDLYPRALAEKYRADDRRVMESGESFETVESHVTADGVRRHVRVIKTPLFEGEEASVASGPGRRRYATGVQVVFWDVTKEHEAEQIVRDQARLLDLATDAIFVANLEGRVQYWSAGAARLYGWPASEAVGRVTSGLLCGDLAMQDEARQKLCSDGFWSGELTHCTRDGRAVQVMSRWTLMRDSEGHPVGALCINSDVTAHKQLEQKFLRAQRLEGIGTLANGIAHDINNALSPILMGIAVLRLPDMPVDERDNALVMIEDSARRGAEIVKQLRSLASASEADRGELNLRHCLKETERVCRRSFPAQVQFKLHVAPDLWTVIGNPVQINQALLSLCLNARDAMSGTGTLSLSAENSIVDASMSAAHEGSKPGPHVVLRVGDTGAGITTAVRDRIFEPFFTTKADGKGSGLGLATVQTVARSHGGFVAFESAEGQGTVFSMFVPANPRAAKSDTDLIPSLRIEGSGRTVLLVDDDPGFQQLTRRVLELSGFKVLEAADGAEGLDTFVGHHESIVLVIADLLMPVMDGPTLIRAIRKASPELPVIVVSGEDAQRAAEKVREFEKVTLLTKPFSIEHLFRTVGAQLGQQALPASTPHGRRGHA